MLDKIRAEQAGNLSELFKLRVQHSPDKVAYQYYDVISMQWLTLTWRQVAHQVAQWQVALKKENLPAGSRVAIMLRNCPQWIIFEQAALGLGLVVVPLYPNDRADNICYIVQDADIKILFFDAPVSWPSLQPACHQMASLQRVISLTPIENENEPRLIALSKWLPDEQEHFELATSAAHRSSLATVVYTSGTTGKPKGVMLSHHNILWNADSGTDSVAVQDDDLFLSFLPLSHMLERTVGYYIPMMTGACVAYARSIELLGEDFIAIKPTVIITVPRIFERVYNKIKTQLATKSPLAKKLFALAVDVGWQRFLYQQHRAAWQPRLLLWPILNMLVAHKIMAKLGGRMRLAVSGGAALSFDVGRTFIALGLTISQGYGLTETSPVVCTNKLDDNDPTTVGQPFRDLEAKLGENDELLIRSPGVMLGYWNNEKATHEIIDADGWLHTGDKAKIHNGHITITGRLKEILVLSNGEKVPPADVEMAIANDPLFEQVLIAGEQRPYLVAITVLNPKQWSTLAEQLNILPTAENLNSKAVADSVLEHIRRQISGFPGYAKVFGVYNTLEPWNVENSMMTPTLKLRRKQIMDKYHEQINAMYQGH